MAHANEHGRLIAAAAKAALVPLGCQRKGQSRFWLSDQRFWTISIEFQPSGWSKGSYLNVGATWLWYVKENLVFDEGYRVGDFISFQNADQFKPLIGGMAARAAEEVRTLQKRFKTIPDIYRRLVPCIRREGWPVYHAAVIAGLVGDVASARKLFDRIGAWQTYYEWQDELKSRSLALAALLGDPDQFRAMIQSVINQRRALVGLPPDPDCLFAASATSGA
jgi:hypothetical protein